MALKSSNGFARRLKSLSLRRKQSSFLILPPELVEAVAALLEPSDLCALRTTCKALNEKSSYIFWTSSLRTVETDFSLVSLQKLEMISKHPQLRHYVHHLTVKGFDDENEILGEGLQFVHLVSLQDILSQLVNCKSFGIYSISTLDHPHLNDFKPTDAIPAILDAVATTGHPVVSFTVDFMTYGTVGGNHLDPKRLRMDRAHFIAVGEHLEQLKLNYTLNFRIIRNWTSDLILHAPRLRKLEIEFGNENECYSFIHDLASSAGLSWSRLQELQLRSIRTTSEDLTALLQKCQQSLRVLKLGPSRLKARGDELRQIFRTLGSFPALETIQIQSLWSGLSTREFVHFPVVSKNPIIDESQGTKFGFESRRYRGAERNVYVEYSGPKTDVALDLLARTLDLIPKRM